MQLREVSPTDPRPAALLDAYFAERAAGFPGPGPYRPARPDPAVFAPPRGVFLVLEDDGAPVGCGGMRPLADDDAGPRSEVKHLYVVPGARGRGLGRRLLAELEARARAAGVATLVLDTNRSLEAAGGLYRSAGFVPVPPYNDNPNATDWYGKRLVAGS
ncbi:GNAT family N-acetyltransferase [Amnibacterium sp. CER49]|uniref:GNAT family N-acetyltransferase n=1 Tax=Amnibacterium sp. CER49 TaxID=3039161 RepID=UPI00244A628B|nr:GNAT family N-acetyltransferase [Amnibacterium sp. CER49]MDH2445011.1 GNAT family N-acetyltransferase [Amnibacterium sp. CER49]